MNKILYYIIIMSNNNIYQDLINSLPNGKVKNEYLNKYQTKIQNGNITLTFDELIDILEKYTEDGKKINNYIVNTIIKDRKMDSFEELDILLKHTNTDFTFLAKFNFFNQVSCSESKSKLSLYNLLFMYKVLLEYKNKNKNNENERNTYLEKTNYFNKIIFLKFLLFFQRLNKLKVYFKEEEQLNNLLSIEEDIHNTLKASFKKDTDTSFLKTLVDMQNVQEQNVQEIYNIVINNIQDSTFRNIEQYKTLFNYNTTTPTKSSKTASFFVGFHGTLMLINQPNNPYKYLTIQSPENMISNLYRWGERGEPTMMFQSMKYSWKQYFIGKNEPITYDVLDKLFQLTLADESEEYNYHTSQTTIPATTNNNIIRIKHYSIDSPGMNTFNSKYQMPNQLVENLKEKISEQNGQNEEASLTWLTESFNTAERIIQLNYLLLNNNIEFNVFKTSCCGKGAKPVGNYGDMSIGIYTEDPNPARRDYQSYLRNYHFPLELLSTPGAPPRTTPRLYIEDFVLERDIYALEDMDININGVQFTLNKGDSFVCNPYIIEYFIKNFNSIITIRPGYIINNPKHQLFMNNNEYNSNNNTSGKTITCPSMGLSCYKVTLAVLTNYEILKFCKDAGIETCDIYDTSCQSFNYISKFGGYSFENDDKTNTNLAKRMPTIDETKILKDYAPSINKLFGDFSDLANRYRDMKLVFVDPPINAPNSPNGPINAPINVEIPVTPVSPDPIFKAAANTPRPLSCIDTMSSIMNKAYSNLDIPGAVKQIIPGTNRYKKQRESITTDQKILKKKNIQREIVNFKRKNEEESDTDRKIGKIKIEGESDTDIDGGRGKTPNQIQKNTYKYKKNIKTRKHKKYSNKKKCKTRTRRRIKTKNK